jgi:hypothetical protein
MILTAQLVMLVMLVCLLIAEPHSSYQFLLLLVASSFLLQ